MDIIIVAILLAFVMVGLIHRIWHRHTKQKELDKLLYFYDDLENPPK